MRPEMEGLCHSLSDQFKLLSPVRLPQHASTDAATPSEHHHHHKQHSFPSASVSDLYATVKKKPRRSSRARSEGNEAMDTPVHRVQSSSLSELDVENAGSQEVDSSKKTPEKKLFIHNRVPPWKQMVRL